jgi:hypothetical protein
VLLVLTKMLYGLAPTVLILAIVIALADQEADALNFG